MKPILVSGLVASGLMLGLGGTAQACTEVLATAPVLRYDFTQQGAIVEPLQLSITDACEGDGRNRRIEIWLRDRIDNNGPQKSLGGLPVEVRQSTVNVLNGVNEGAIRFARFSYARSASPAAAQLDIRLPGGSSNAVSDTRQYDLFWRYQDGAGETRIGSRPVTFAMVVTPAFEAAIAGGGKTHTMDFGQLTAGDAQSVNLRLRATDPFQVTLASQNGGVMRRVSTCGAAAVDRLTDQNSIAYSTTLDGQPISMRNGYVNIQPRGDAVTTFENVPFKVQIDPNLNPGEKLAGQYCDVITLRISQKI